MSDDIVITWPSGLRRQFKALVRKGVGSNPTVVIPFALAPTRIQIYVGVHPFGLADHLTNYHFKKLYS
jgi:hypothetical protein